MAKGETFTKSFYDWCIENNRQEFLELWDYDLNNVTPENIGFRSNKKYWFKCSRGIHKSESKTLDSLVRRNKKIICNQCNSVGQYLIDTYGENALELYWDYKMNTVNPFQIAKRSKERVWIKCQDTNYHGIYDIICHTFTKGNRCPYCAMKKIHTLDSFAQYHIDNTDPDFLEKYWSNKNTVDPFNIAPSSIKKVWIKCQKDEEHEDYKIDCCHFTRGQRCSECRESYGERKIAKWLNDKNIKYIREKTFSNLFGTGNDYLRYDFYIPEYNLLIEYQGEFHDGTVKGTYKYDLEKQQEHDRRKREYAEQNGIQLLEIWYWNYDNIEEILNKNIK